MSAGNKRGGAALTSQASKQINRQQLQLAKTTLIAFPPQGLMNLQLRGLKTSPSPSLTLEQSHLVDSSQPLLFAAGMSSLFHILLLRLPDPAQPWRPSSSELQSWFDPVEADQVLLRQHRHWWELSQSAPWEVKLLAEPWCDQTKRNAPAARG